MSTADQASGLRQWAGQATARRTLVVVGLPGTTAHYSQWVLDLLANWANQGQRWVGTPDAWRIAPVQVNSPHLTTLIDQQPRWALWVGNDLDAFRRSFRVLLQLRNLGGPGRLLAVHPIDMSRRGLLNNLQQAAWRYLGVELLVMAR